MTHPIDPALPRDGYLLLVHTTSGSTRLRYARSPGAAESWASEELAKPTVIRVEVKPV